ncbi:MAG: aconitate hydratase AcnA [Myxococcota bacterium]
MTNSFGTRDTLNVAGQSLTFYNLKTLSETHPSVMKLPFSLRVLVENLLRHEDGRVVTQAEIEAIANWDPKAKPTEEIAYHPARVLLQDFTGVPAIVDLAAMRDAMTTLGGDPNQINPLQPADLVIDHSVMVDRFASRGSLALNTAIEYQRNQERYQFLRWGQQAFENFSVVPPGTGICHQVNLEYLAKVAFVNEKTGTVYPDTLVGTDSHTTMINGLGVLGWGVGGIEAEAAMLGQPVSMLIPQVVGFKLSGKLAAGATATDLVLRVVEMLRAKGVVGKFVEFYGDGLDALTLADRATIANMAPEYGATMGFFPVDAETINYLRFTNRSEAQVEIAEAFCRATGLFRDADTEDPIYSDTLGLDLSTVVPAIAGPKRPQDRIALTDAKAKIDAVISEMAEQADATVEIEENEVRYDIGHGTVVIAAITSCTNTSNPAVMLGAGLLAKNAVGAGLRTKPWVKTSLAPGSKVVTEYLEASLLMPYLEALGFHLVGYGCTTCIGNSGPLPEKISRAIHDHNLLASSVLSGNRNFEGRIGPDVRMNFLASPPLVVAFALAGRANIDFATEPVGYDSAGEKIMLEDIWPSAEQISEAIRSSLSPEQFARQYSSVFEGDDDWRALASPSGKAYDWAESTYVRKPPFFEDVQPEPSRKEDIKDARILALLGDSVTTDHISPAGSIAKDSPAAKYLTDNGVSPSDFNSYGSRRGNHEVMMRGTFANIRLRNAIVPGVEGGYTKHFPSGDEMTIYDAAMRYQAENVPLVVIAGAEYGTGSSRDWAAKGTQLLGVKAVIAKSFERIHRSNLIGMGVLPLQFPEGVDAGSLGLTGEETFDIEGLSGEVTPRQTMKVTVKGQSFDALCRLDTPNEVDYWRHGGILVYVLRNLAAEQKAA